MGTICENELDKSIEEHKWKIKILKTQYKSIMVGVAPSDFDIHSERHFENCGWYYYCSNSHLYSDSDNFAKQNFHNKKIQAPSNNSNNNNISNKVNEKLYGTMIETNKKINNNQNTQTVQNIIVKSNINISFINNYNTTYLHKSKKKQKKIRSRNNQELSKLNNIENKVNIINNKIKIDDDNNNKFNKIADNTTNKAQNSNKEKSKNTPLISPKLNNKEMNNNEGVKKKVIVKNQNIKIKQNIINSFINKVQQEKGTVNGFSKTRISSGLNKNKNDNNKKLIYNFIGKV